MNISNGEVIHKNGQQNLATYQSSQNIEIWNKMNNFIWVTSVHQWVIIPD